MSYFFALKNHISLTSNGEYISSRKTQLKKICTLNKTVFNYQCQIYKTKLLTLSILLNINTKREYIIIPIIPIGGY